MEFFTANFLPLKVSKKSKNPTFHAPKQRESLGKLPYFDRFLNGFISQA